MTLPQVVRGEEAQNLFNRLRKILSNTGDDDGFGANRTDIEEEFVKDSIAALLVTKPLNRNEPFKVTYMDDAGEYLKNVDGTEFNVHSARVNAGNHDYRIHFYASSPDREYVYEFRGLVRSYGPPLKVEEAKVYRNTGESGTSVEFSERRELGK